MENNTGLYIRPRGSAELWQLFLGGYTKAKPSALFYSYHEYFQELHDDYEWVVLERKRSNNGTTAMFRVGDSKPVNVLIDKEEPEWKGREVEVKRVECLSLWHDESGDQTFMGSVSNRICPECVEKEYRYFYNLERE